MTILVKQRDVSRSISLSGVDPLISRILIARGVTSVEQLDRNLNRLLPYRDLSGITGAVQGLYAALQEQKRIVVIGDFDADGATSTALTVLALQLFGLKQINYLVPNRFEYGYGLTPEIVSVAIERYQPQLMITVDNGITSCEGVELANKHGVQVIITDHHLPADSLPNALAIVNPNQREDQFASKTLAGVGVIFYVMLALRAHLREKNWFQEQGISEPNMAQLLDLVALGTVADVVPLDYNNRILIYHGLQRIRRGQFSTGIRALLQIARCDSTALTASDFAFKIAPRLNAAGRLKDMSIGIACLLETDFNKALSLASQLDQLNHERREIEKDMQAEAVAIVEKLHLEKEGLPSGLCLFNPKWHQGVIGILAARIKDRVHRPVIIFTQENDKHLRASARSIAGVHIRDVLANIVARYPSLLLKFGGHAMAAGLTILKEHYVEFTRIFDAQVAECLTPEMLDRVIYSDGVLTDQQLTMGMAEQLIQAGPWGQCFPEPIFEGEFSVCDQQILGYRHLKLHLQVPNSRRQIEAIAFNVDLEQWPNHRCQTVYLVYRLSINQYLGTRKLQMIVEHMRVRKRIG